MVLGLVAAILAAVLHGSSPAPAPKPSPPTQSTPVVQPATAAQPVAGATSVTQVSVTNSPITSPLPAGYLGLALEFSTPPKWSSNDGLSPNPVLVQLIRNLAPGGHPVIRIGGASAERTWWPVSGMKRPPGITYTLTRQWMNSVRTLAQATGAQLLLGIDLAAGSLKIAHAEAEAYLQQIGRQYIDAVEIGNEPEFYSRVPWYRRQGVLTLPWYSRAGTPVYARNAGYGPGQWASQYAAMLRQMGGLTVAGPDSGSDSYLHAFERFLSPHSQVRMMTTHAYALTNCETVGSVASYPSVAHLLNLSASRSLVNNQGSFINFAHSSGASYRIDELGSVSCNGKAGVSDTMASALWLADALMSLAASHVDGINLHTFPHEINNLFDFARTNGQWVGIVHPLYYGALLFAQAAPTGSRLLAVQSPNQSTLRTWATLGPDGTLRVLLLNDSILGSSNVRISVPAAFAGGPAAETALTAPSAYATAGISLGGVGFGTQTTTGTLAPSTPANINPQNGDYYVTLPPASGTLLTLHPQG